MPAVDRITRYKQGYAQGVTDRERLGRFNLSNTGHSSEEEYAAGYFDGYDDKGWRRSEREGQ